MSKIFSSLPSLNDLLEAAPLKSLFERVGRNRVVSETGAYLNRLRGEAQTAAQSVFSVSPQELAQRVARWITSTPPRSPRAVINGTGILLAYEPPLAGEALDALAGASEYQLRDGYETELGEIAHKFTGAAAVAVFASAPAAMMSVLAALAKDGHVVLRRGELEHDPLEPNVTELANSLHIEVRETGTVNHAALADFERELKSGGSVIVSLTRRWTTIVGDSAVPTLAELAQLCYQHGKPLVVDLGWSGVKATTAGEFADKSGAAEALQAGADIVLLRGHGLLGGPVCGVLLGRKDLVDRVTAHPLAKASLAATPIVAALAATLQLHENAATGDQAIPLRSMLTTSIENLKLRAERLAPQIAATGAVASAEAIATTSYLSARKSNSESIPDYAISIQPKDMTPAALADKLLAGPQSIAVEILSDRVVIHLRTITPRHDVSLVDTFAAMVPAQPVPPSSPTVEPPSVSESPLA